MVGRYPEVQRQECVPPVIPVRRQCNATVRRRARHLPNHTGLIEHMLDRFHVEGHKIVVDRAKFLGGIDPQLNSMAVR
jgi:hypothetical protein